MDDTGEGTQATRRELLRATAGALATGVLPGRSGAQQASDPAVYVGAGFADDSTLCAVDTATGRFEWTPDTVNDVPGSVRVACALR